MIPKRIFTIWLNESDVLPELEQRCIKTHDLPGYDHQIITLKNCFRNTHYIQECLSAKNWAKATDYLRMWYLRRSGGIYLDADVEVLKPFDPLLKDAIFVGREENNFISNAIIGSVGGHHTLSDYLGKVERNFIGSGDLIFQPGMFLWTEIVHYTPEVKIYPPEYFLPYNHHNNKLNLTPNSYCIHHFSKSWVKTKE